MPSEEIPPDVKALGREWRDKYRNTEDGLDIAGAIECAIMADRATRQSSLPADGVPDRGPMRDDEDTTRAMDRAKSLRDCAYRLLAASERLEQEAEEYAIANKEHIGADGI